MKMYYLTVTGDNGDCMVSWDNNPTWDFDNAMMFDSRAEANDFLLSDKAKEWTCVEMGDRIDICETDIPAWAVVKASNGNPVFCKFEKIGGREVLFQSDILNECTDWIENWYSNDWLENWEKAKAN